MSVVTLPVPQTQLPGLPALLDGTLWRRWSASGAVFALTDFRSAVRYVRLKPSTSCRVVVFRPDTIDHETPAFLIHLYSDADRAAQAFRKIDGREADDEAPGTTPFLDEAAAAVVAPYSRDPELPALRHFHRPFRLRRALSELLLDRYADCRVRKHRTRVELLTFKPGRRAVFRAEVQLQRQDGAEKMTLPLHLQIEEPATLEQSHRNLCLVHEARPRTAEWSVPEPIGRVESRCLVASAWEDGTPLTGFLGSAFETATLSETANALAGLHGLDVAGRDAQPARRSRDLLGLAHDMCELLPDERRPILQLAERLTALVERLADPDARVLTHGDFHPGQVLLRRGRVILIDFDRAGLDHASTDIGEILARLIEAGREGRPTDRFVRAYRDAAKSQVGDAEINAALAIALFRRASVPFRELASDWPDRMRQRLQRSAQAAELAQ